jgi:type I restriction enzyme M protein
MIATVDAHDGRVAVIVPPGVFFRVGAEDRIHQQVIDENLLDAVIGLPPNVSSGTGIPVAVLVFRRQQPDDATDGVNTDARRVRAQSATFTKRA